MSDQIKNLLLTFTDGTKLNQTKSMAYEKGKEYTLGRGSDVDFKIDQDMEAVSRRHASITVKEGNEISIVLKDLGSTNGLFVNDQRITGSSEIMPGDIIKLGTNGPTLKFDLDPRPSSLLAKTRVIEVGSAATETATREIKATSEADDVLAKIDTALGNKPANTIGKDTVERMIQSSEKKSSTRSWVLGIFTIAAFALAGFMFLKPDPIVDPPDNPPTDTAWSSEKIAKEYGNSTVKISTSYKLVHTPSGQDIYHYYDLVDGKPTAMYVKVGGNTIEPYCVAGKPNAISKLMTNGGSGTGFVINPEGYIVTNRHVASSWMDQYSFPYDAFPGKLIMMNKQNQVVPDPKSDVKKYHVSGFIPDNMKTLNNSVMANKVIQGEIFYLDVLFPGDDNGIPATLSRVSNKHDVALLKIDHPGSLKAVKMEAIDIRPGQQVTVMGFPGVAATEYKTVQQKTFSTQAREYQEVAKASVFNGIISKSVGDIEGVVTKKSGSYSEMGESYQLDINATGSGNSGGPMFDDQGRVIGIYYAGMSRANGNVSFAVPIKYALDLIGIKDTFK